MSRQRLAATALLVLSVAAACGDAGAGEIDRALAIKNKTSGPVEYHRDGKFLCRIEPGADASECDREINYLWPNAFRLVLANGTEYVAYGVSNVLCIEETGLTDCQGSSLPSGGGHANWYAGWEAFDRGDYGEAIRLITTAIASGDLGALDRSLAYFDRGSSHSVEEDFDDAIADYSEAIRLAPDDAYYAKYYYQSRASAYLDQEGPSDRAIADLSEVIRLDPSEASVYSIRAQLYQQAGEHDRAIADLSEAIRLKPDTELFTALAYAERGVSRFANSDYAAAAADFDQSMSQGNTVYGALWGFLSRAKLGAPDHRELERDAAKADDFDTNAWVRSVVDFFLGRITADELRAAAATGDSDDLPSQACATEFYVGEYELLRGDEAAAREPLRRAAQTCPPPYPERIAAVAELKRLGL